MLLAKQEVPTRQTKRLFDAADADLAGRRLFDAANAD
jgi:hypothetical protein